MLCWFEADVGAELKPGEPGGRESGEVECVLGETNCPSAVVVAPPDDFVEECIVRGDEALFEV